MQRVLSSTLRKGDVVLVEAGDFVPCDGDIIDGVASINESAVTGESACRSRERRRSERRGRTVHKSCQTGLWCAPPRIQEKAFSIE